MRLRCLLGVCLLAYGSLVYAEQTNSDWRKTWWLASQSSQQQTLVWLAGDVKIAPKKVPLGSLWKLFVYNYSVDNGLPDQPYQCHAGKNAAVGDEYCCSQDETITRDVALARSCGAYFAPKRLQIDAKSWQQYWQKQVPEVAWLHSLNNMQAQTQSSVQDILLALQGLSPSGVAQSRQALLGRLLQPQWSELLPHLGGAYRFKTFTWEHPQYAGAYFGGGAGWLTDGTVFWLGGTSSSREVMLKTAPMLAEKLPVSAHAQQKFDEACVAVHYFKRYPIEKIALIGQPNIKVSGGTLRGPYAVKFSNGNALQLHSSGELTLINFQGKPQIWGKLGLQEYVARVVDREADASKTEAAKALSIAARSYVFQNAQFHQGCWQIDDDSRTQRVSPNAASSMAKSVSAMTEGLILTGSPIYYHQNKSAVNTLNWQAAVKRGALGDNYLAILHDAYPNASWRLNQQAQQCQRLPQAEQYVQQNSAEIQRKMRNIAGFEPVQGLKICQLDYGNPYADQQTLSMFVRDWRSENDRVTLWHEYLHLALRFHPNGGNEDLIEPIARELAQNLAKETRKKIRHAQ
ncbi:MAG TPA: DUF2300 domain-containing protein [Methylotenera sp.]|nr:DUF2300 domain-containing protein [Methylotenera sp.]HPH04232.1 DUF2300 domain-containing protein [Methylotenera sp.]HPM99786.1 DUF2300 domain-containing protein [Methylotenera sp.]